MLLSSIEKFVSSHVALGTWISRSFALCPALCLAILVASISSTSSAQDRFGGIDIRDRGSLNDRWQGNNWLTGPMSGDQWSLGVRGDSTETGFLIIQVTPGSAAERARLQRGDTIITVEGFQVGKSLAGCTISIKRSIVALIQPAWSQSFCKTVKLGDLPQFAFNLMDILRRLLVWCFRRRFCPPMLW